MDKAQAKYISELEQGNLQLQAENERLRDELDILRTVVQINCNPPSDCNDPAVLKGYMEDCYKVATMP